MRFPEGAECKEVQELASRGCEVVDSVTSWVKNFDKNKESNLKSLRGIKRSADLLQAASLKPLSVGLFGPSQVGKSFLTGSLCNPQSGIPLVKNVADGVEDAEWYGKEGINFLKYVNQQRSGGLYETTGVVTRLTTNPAVPALECGTYVARVVSHRDFIDMLAMGFRAECGKLEEYTVAQINSCLDSIPLSSTAPKRELVEDLLFVMDQLHLNSELDNHYVSILEKSQLRKYLEGLTGDPGPAGWVKLASVFWGCGRCPGLDELYKRVYSLMQRLDFAEVMELPWNTIMRKNERDNLVSVTFVEVLNGFFDESGSDRINVYYRKSGDARNGSIAINRSEISLLIDELILPMVCDSTEESLLQKTDIIDFPGALPPKSSGGIGCELFGCTPDGYKMTMYAFRRGKLTRLFDNYCERRELSALFVCVDDRELVATLLPGQIARWIKTRYPGYPELSARDRENPALFLVRTKADLLFSSQVAVAGSDINRGAVAEFINQQKAFLSDRIPKDSRWYNSWAGGGPFNNQLFIYNPVFRTLQTDYERVFEKNRSMYMNDDFVRSYVKNYEAVWNAFAQPTGNRVADDDGGARYLVRAVNNTICVQAKCEEIRSGCIEIMKKLDMILPDVECSDLESRRQAARKKAGKVLELIKANEKEWAMGRLLKSMSLHAYVLEDGIRRGGVDLAGLFKTWKSEAEKDLRDEYIQEMVSLLCDELLVMKKEKLSGEWEDLLNTILQTRGIKATSCAAAYLINQYTVSLGVDYESGDLPELPLSTGTGINSWSYIYNHWMRHLPEVFCCNIKDGVPVQAGNSELKVLREKIVVS